MVKNSAANIGGVGSIPGLGRWQDTPVFLPGESHGQRILVEPGRLQSVGSQKVGPN